MAFAFGELTTISIGGTIANVLSASWSGYSRDTVPTHCCGDEFKTIRPSCLLDAGELTVTAMYDGSSHAAVAALAEDIEPTTVTITLSDDEGAIETRTCSEAFVTGFSINGISKEDGNVECEIKVKLNDSFSAAGSQGMFAADPDLRANYPVTTSH
jgi:hypothetical protein